jgi:hypothetical protein
MRRVYFCRLLVLLNLTSLIAGGAFAADTTTTIQTEQSKLMKAPNAYAKIGADLFGDRVNLYNGGVDFVQTDVSVPGNNSLPMSIARRLVAGRVAPRDSHFGQWELEIPHLHGIFSQIGWTNSSPTESIYKRCSVLNPPPDVPSSFGTAGIFSTTEYWHGNSLYVPGAGDQEILIRNTTQNLNIPTDLAASKYPHVTKELWALSCITMPSGEGEGFIAVAPNGTKYYFDQMVSRVVENLEKPFPNPVFAAKTSDGKVVPQVASSAGGPTLKRKEVWILPSKVVDKYGNTVTYTYNPANKWQLTKMLASDGRQIDITYVPGTNHIQSVNDGSRIWNYSYSGTAFPETQILDTVTQPDGSTWKLAGMAALTDYNVGYIAGANCSDPGTVINQALIGTMTHPSGAVGQFTMQPKRHGRSKVFQQCIMYGNDGLSSYQKFAKEFDTYSLVNKTIQGPGVSPLVWTYDFNPNNVTGDAFASWETCTSNCGGKKWIKVTDPKKNVTLHTFGNVFNVDEGQSQKVEVLQWNPATQTATEVVSTTSTSYKIYPYALGESYQNRAESFLSRRYTPVEQRITTQQGVSFTWAAQFDDVNGNIPRPIAITRSNSLGVSRSEAMEYVDKMPKWVISQVGKVTESSTGKVVVENTYNAFADLLTTKNFGILDKTYTYNVDGTLYTVKIGNTPDTTNYSNYKRGKAQTIKYAGGGTETLVVDNVGFVTSLTGEAGFVTTFESDAMGRIKKVIYPTGDTPAWNPTNISFEQVTSNEFGLASGHWRQTVETGNAQTVTYLDAFWRPVLTRTVDTANPSVTSQMLVSQYDHQGNAIYSSYPQRDITSINATPAGTYTSYDALGRLSSTVSDSELGSLTTQVNYLAGFKKSVTNPKGQVTTTEFTGFDEPTESYPVKILAPEGLTVDIARDIFGKPTSVTRSGGGKSAVRSYVYDTNERLCKTIEPEVGATIQNYDGANNISWKAVHATLTSPVCDRSSVPAAKKVSYTYSNRQQLWMTAFGTNSTNISRNYTIDGLPDTISSYSSTWTSDYNKRRLPKSEILTYGVNYPLTYTYTPNAHLSTLKYPDGKIVDYAPNALGQASQVGSYASNLSYHPNGAVAGFTYGNGIVHTLQQNVRGLPQVSTDNGILQDAYSYDANANVMSIADGTSNNTSRSMTYDNLDRLKTVNAPGIWGNASYNYDVLDNITQSVIGGRTNMHNYDITKNRLTSITSSDTAYNLNYDDYDEQGNIKKRGSQLFEFDLVNRLTKATGKVNEYRYDGLGHRLNVASADGTDLIQVYSPAGQLLWTKQSAGPKPAKETKYIYLNRHVIAEVEVAK